MTRKTSLKNFETKLSELEQLVENLESGELDLEDALTQFEKGIKMTRECQTALASAEQRVKVLVEKNGESQLIDFVETPSAEP